MNFLLLVGCPLNACFASEALLAQPQAPANVATMAIIDASDSDLNKAAAALSETGQALAARESELQQLRQMDATIRDVDRQLRDNDTISERQLRALAKKRREDDKHRRQESMRQAGVSSGDQHHRPSSASSTSTKVFEVSLKHLERRAVEQHTGSGPPPMLPVVEAPLVWLEQHAMRVEGLFRLSGDANVINQMRASFDAGRTPDFHDGSNPHNIAGVLKLWLRKLPEPLLTFDLYQVCGGVYGLVLLTVGCVRRNSCRARAMLRRFNS